MSLARTWIQLYKVQPEVVFGVKLKALTKNQGTLEFIFCNHVYAINMKNWMTKLFPLWLDRRGSLQCVTTATRFKPGVNTKAQQKPHAPYVEQD